MRSGLALLCLGGLAVGGGATTLRVDGPGDGDGMNGDEFDTIRGALVALAAQGQDGSPDRVEVVVDAFTSADGFAVNGTASTFDGFPSLTDDIAFEGDADANGQPCVITVNSQAVLRSFGALDFQLADGQDVLVRDFTVIPAPASGSDSMDGIMQLRPAAPLIAASLSLEAVVWTASDALGNIVPPDQALPAGSTSWTSGLYVRGFPSSPSFTVRVVSSEIAPGIGSALSVDTGAISAEVVDSRLLRSYAGVFVSHSAGGLIRFLRTEIAQHRDQGIQLFTPDSGPPLRIEILEGCEIADNGLDGLFTGGNFSDRIHEIVIRGTPSEPVIFRGNQGAGVLAGYAHAPTSVEHAVFFDNVRPWVFDGADLFTYPVTFTNCLFASNELEQFVVLGSVTDQGPAVIAFENCTFHGDKTNAPPGTDCCVVSVNGMGQVNPLTLHFENCILSGPGTQRAVETDQPGLTLVEFERCAVPLRGPERVENLTVAPFDPMIVRDLLMLGCSPIYVNTDLPPGPGSFDVQEVLYDFGAQGTISGYGDFVGGVEFCTAGVSSWADYR